MRNANSDVETELRKIISEGTNGAIIEEPIRNKISRSYETNRQYLLSLRTQSLQHAKNQLSDLLAEIDIDYSKQNQLDL